MYFQSNILRETGEYCMKRVLLTIITMFFIANGSDLSRKLGFEFSSLGQETFSNTSTLPMKIGCRYHFTPVYSALLGGTFGIETDFDFMSIQSRTIGVAIDQSFYLPAIKRLDQMIYADAMVRFRTNTVKKMIFQRRQ